MSFSYETLAILADALASKRRYVLEFSQFSKGDDLARVQAEVASIDVAIDDVRSALLALPFPSKVAA